MICLLLLFCYPNRLYVSAKTPPVLSYFEWPFFCYWILVKKGVQYCWPFLSFLPWWRYIWERWQPRHSRVSLKTSTTIPCRFLKCFDKVLNKREHLDSRLSRAMILILVKTAETFKTWTNFLFMGCYSSPYERLVSKLLILEYLHSTE